ncbi:MAG: HEPN domain-containing protein [Elusimicrobiota bacterium]
MKKKIALKWFKQALHDLDMAEKNIDIGGYDVSAFLAHQSVEKLLKTIFILSGKNVPRTHYLDDMARTLKLNKEVTDVVSDLTVDYAFSRYPDVSENVPYEEYTKEISKEKVGIAKEIFEALKKYYESLLKEEKND